MNYLDQIRKDVLSEDSDRIAEEVDNRILFQNYYIIPKDERISLKDIIRNIGTEEDIQTIIDHFRKWTEPNPQLFVYVACNLLQRIVDSDKSHQKVLDFVIRNVTTGYLTMNGGILFQDGKISFHS